MKLLLHTCCAPCAIAAVQEARKDGFTVTGFFYNPNIHPAGEYERRKKEAENYFKSEGLELIIPGYDTAPFFERAGINDIAQSRCRACWDLRIRRAFLSAKEMGFDAFTTTLLASPYQEHRVLEYICASLDNAGPEFYYKDFRTGFSAAKRQAKEEGMYRQNYCGCVFSMVEREEAKRVKRKSEIRISTHSTSSGSS